VSTIRIYFWSHSAQIININNADDDNVHHDTNHDHDHDDDDDDDDNNDESRGWQSSRS